MTSLQQAHKCEKDVSITISQKQAKIKDLQASLKMDILELENFRANRYDIQESIFEKTYGIKAMEIRRDYVSLLNKCCGSCELGHTVKVPGVTSHILLLTKHYNVCKPTPLIIEAFETIGQDIWVDPKPHVERWGN